MHLRYMFKGEFAMSSQAITETDIRTIVERFYAEVRADQVLNAGFAAVTDWDDHLERMMAFWGAMMMSTGRYKGNPVAMHLIHLERIDPGMFERWLTLWRKVTSDALSPEIAAEIQSRAVRIASRLSSALFGSDHAVPPARPLELASRPYRSTPVFDKETVPKPLLQSYRLRPQTWAKLTVLEGLHYHLRSQPTIEVDACSPVIIPPDVPHHLQIVGPVKLQLHFYDHQPAPY
ncbi:hypothetical protein N183_34740 [Sinorhizobium sp. Sb3]|nr:hypothetical protein N183_34740 [Sinorhizobium sp. Sb3]